LLDIGSPDEALPTWLTTAIDRFDRRELPLLQYRRQKLLPSAALFMHALSANVNLQYQC
jgi:hypothetical protein